MEKSKLILVSLDKEYGSEFLEKIMNTIGMIKGVGYIKSVDHDFNEACKEWSYKQSILHKIIEQLIKESREI